MAFKKDLCRNFQRGSCQYGERCKFIHATQQQQQKPSSNPFGFGTQSQSKSFNEFPNKQHQFKPFENKWSRFSPISNNTAADNQPSQAANHKCTDPDSCKRQITEDFQNEKPLWKLTCYCHSKNGPCDIVGDVSYEELRAVAYDEAKRGLSLQSIVERERNLLSSKLIEFENLLRSPYVAPPNSSHSRSSFPGAMPTAISSSGQTNHPPSVSSFSQLGASLNMASGTRSSTPLTNAFGQPNLSNSGQTSSAFETRPSATSNGAFGQLNGFSNSSQTPSIFGKGNFTPANPGSMSSQLPSQASRNPFSSNISDFGNNIMLSNQRNSFSSSEISTQITHSPTAQPLVPSDAPMSGSDAVGQAVTNIQSINDMQRGMVSVDASIWLKEKWTRGEIPEEAPPAEYV